MSATITLSGNDGKKIEIIAGLADQRRYVSFGVPPTEDTIRLGWARDADFTIGKVPVTLGIGPWLSQDVELENSEIKLAGPAPDPTFGPNGDAIVRAIGEAFAMAAPRATFTVQMSINALDLVRTVAQYRATGAALGTYLAVSYQGDWPKYIWPESHPDRIAAAAEIGALLAVLADFGSPD